MKFYYADAQNKTAGPVSWLELQELIRTGAMKADPMIIAEGGGEWKLLSTFIAGAGPGTARGFADPLRSRAGWNGNPIPFSGTFLGDLVAAPLQRVKSRLSEDFTNRSLEFCRNAGQYAVLAGGALGLIYCIVTAIQQNQLVPALVGIGFIVALAIAQFVAAKFLGAGDALIASTPHRISSEAFLECSGLFAILAGIGILAAGIYSGIELGGARAVAIIPPCLADAVILVYLAATALNPRIVNVTTGDGGSGEEAIGILGFFFKAFLKLLPMQFLLWGILADVTILGSFWFKPQPANPYGGDPFAAAPPLGNFLPLPVMPPGYWGIAMVLGTCLLPFLGYFLFLIFNLGLEIIRAILSLTGKHENQGRA